MPKNQNIYKEAVEPILKTTFVLFVISGLTSKVAGELPAALAVLLFTKYAYDKGEKRANSLSNRLFGRTMPQPQNQVEDLVSKADLVIDGTAKTFDQVTRKFL